MGQLGLSISSRGGFAPLAFADYARRAEAAGFTAVFATENASDAMALAGMMGGATTRIAVGTAVTNLYLRHPALAAMTAATLDEACGGRFVLGLGTVNPRFNFETLGLPQEPPLTRTREYVEVVRAVLSGQPVTYSGEVFRLNDFTPYRPPPRADLPIYLAALLPGMLRLAGEVADGVLLNLMSARQVRVAIERVQASAEAAGRDPADVAVACVLPCYVSDSLPAARQAARQLVAGYALHPSAARLFAGSGDAPQMAAVQERLLAGDRDGALATVGEHLATGLVVHGPPDSCLEQVAAFRAAGVDLPVLFPIALDGDWGQSLSAAVDAFRDPVYADA